MKNTYISLVIFTLILTFTAIEAYNIGYSQANLDNAKRKLKSVCLENYKKLNMVDEDCLKYIEQIKK
jgi:hypothetical protein